MYFLKKNNIYRTPKFPIPNPKAEEATNLITGEHAQLIS